MNVIHELPIGDLNGKEARTLASLLSTNANRIANDVSICSTTNSTEVVINTKSSGGSNGGAHTTTNFANSSKANSKDDNNGKPAAAEGGAEAAALNSNTAATNKGDDINLHNNDINNGEELKIIGHIKNIEKINEKRRIFLNNTISEHTTIDEQSETEKKTQTINGKETVLSEIRTHTRRQEQEKVNDSADVGKGVISQQSAAKANVNSDEGAAKTTRATSATTFQPTPASPNEQFVTTASAIKPTTTASPKYATLPRLPGASPPPKPPMLSRTRSMGVGDAPRSVPTSPLKTITTTAITGGGGAPLATATPTSTPTTPTATTPLILLRNDADVCAAAAAAAASKSSPASGTTTLITMLPPQTSKADTVQLREYSISASARRHIMERPVSLSPAAPKQISVTHYERLIEELKCPGCAYPMKSPILLCKTGHSICQQCTRVLLLCPLCKEPFTTIRSLTVEALCSKAHFRCSNAAGGCTVRLQIDLLSWHEKQCIYKPMKCFMGRVWGDCDWSGREAHWKEHLEREHADKVFHTQTTDMIWNMGVKQKPLTGYYCFIVYDEMFNFYEVYDKERILFTMACTSTIKEKKHQYAFEVTIVHQENEALAITQKYPVHSEYDNDILAEGTCISMPLTDLAKFIGEDRLLHYRVRIVEIKTPRKVKSSQRNSPNASIHPTDFQQTQIEGVNLKSVPADVIVTRKLQDIPYADNASTSAQSATQNGRGVNVVESAAAAAEKGEREVRDKVRDIYNGKYVSGVDSGSESDPEFEAFIAKKWGTPQLHFNRKFLKSSTSNLNNADDEATLGGSSRRLDDKISVTSASTTSYKKRVTNSLRKSFRGFKAPQIFTNNNNTKKSSDGGDVVKCNK